MNGNGEKPRVGVIGSGYWGKNLVRNFHALGALSAICDSDEATLSALAAQYPGVSTHLAVHDLLARPGLDAVVVASPAETHFTLAREVLAAGKHVFVEKPLTLKEEEASELIALAREKKLSLMVGHLLRYHPAFIRLQEAVAAGELGRINYIYSHRLNLGKIRREENILWSFAPHDISMILALAGEGPEGVMATGGAWLHSRIADVTTTHLEFRSGMKAHIFVSWLHPFKEQKLVVVGDRKMAVFDDTRPWSDKLVLYPHEIRWENNLPVPARAEPERVEVPEAEPLRAECGHFLECVTTGKKPRTDGREGLAVLSVLNAAQKSLNRGGRRVPLSVGGQPEFLVHETAVVDPGVTIGKGTKIWHFSHILSGTVLGENVNVGQNVVIGPDVSVGNGCKIQNNVSLYKGVTLEDGVFCGPSCVFTNVYNPRAGVPRMNEIRPTLVKTGATLGANCTIVCGVTIGAFSLVGPGPW